MTVLVLPDDILQVTERSFRLRAFNLFSTALFSSQRLPSGPVAQVWTAQLTLIPRVGCDWRVVDGLLGRLRGMNQPFRFFDPARQQPWYNEVASTTSEGFSDGTLFSDETGFLSGLISPNVSVQTAAARGDRFMIAQGFPASISAALSEGDLFEVRPNGMFTDWGNLYLVTQKANSDTSGYAGLAFEPGLREAVVAGDMIVLRKPTCVFRLLSDDEADMSVTPPDIGSTGFSAVEVLRT